MYNIIILIQDSFINIKIIYYSEDTLICLYVNITFMVQFFGSQMFSINIKVCILT